MHSENINLLIPKLSKDVKIYPFAGDSYLVHQTQFDYRVRVAKQLKLLIDCIDNNKTLSEISLFLFSTHSIDLAEPEIYDLLYKKLANYGIVESDTKIEKVDNSKYLSLRIMLFNQKQVEKVSHIFLSIFSPKRFYFVLFFSLLVVGATLITNYQRINLELTFSKDFLAAFALTNVISLFLHELGHATACRKFGANHGGIGFGFYIFSPVLFADVSDAWKLKPSERIIIDLAGLYMQSILNVFILFLYFLLDDRQILMLSFIFSMGMLLNLNPFFRRDGYWAVCDALNIPNLKKKSDDVILKSFQWLYSKSPNPLLKRLNVFLFLYGTFNWIFIIIVISTIILKDPYSILHFPFNAYTFIVTLIERIPNVSLIWFKEQVLSFILPIIFYTLIYNILIKKHFIKLIKKLNPSKP
jgi:putative peptide zinc metalloprotease protein